MDKKEFQELLTEEVKSYKTLLGRTINHNSMPSAQSYHCRMGDGLWLLLNSYG